MILRFWLEWGGGCLWPGDDAARAALGSGPLDLGLRGVDGHADEAPALVLPEALVAWRDRLTAEHDTALNPLYPPDPSLWSAAKCARFNAGMDAFVAALRVALPEHDIRDEQPRYTEDPGLADWLAAHPGFAALD